MSNHLNKWKKSSLIFHSIPFPSKNTSNPMKKILRINSLMSMKMRRLGLMKVNLMNKKKAQTKAPK